LVKNYLSEYLNKINQIVCCFLSVKTANQFQKCVHIRRKRALSMYKYLKNKNIIENYELSDSANMFIKLIGIKRKVGLELYKALKSCIKNYVKFTISGGIRDKENNECLVYYDLYLYAKEKNMKKIFEIMAEYIRQDTEYFYFDIDGHGVLENTIDLVVSMVSVTENEVDKKTLIKNIEKDIKEVFEQIKENITCNKKSHFTVNEINLRREKEKRGKKKDVKQQKLI